MKTASIFLKKKLEENIDHFLDNSQIHYLKKVLKIKDGEHIHIYDGTRLHQTRPMETKI